jgi:glycosyltransferase involved in cell wall biosynthesis
MDQPLISIVMPAYNAEKYLRAAIDCVLNQTYPHFELLIADDASTDATKSIIDSYKDHRIRLFHNDQNIGYLKTCNKLLALSQGAYITFQDADDLCELNRIELQLNAFRQDRDLEMCGTNCLRIDLDGKLLEKTNFPVTHELIKSNFPNKYLYVGSTFMLTRKAYTEFGAYNEYFDRVGAEDIYWSARIILKSKTINLPQHLYHYRMNPNSVTRNVKFFRQYYISYLVADLIGQYMQFGTDPLDQKNVSALKKMEDYYEMRELFWRKQNGKAIRTFFFCLLKNPFRGKRFYKEAYMHFGKILMGA